MIQCCLHNGLAHNNRQAFARIHDGLVGLVGDICAISSFIMKNKMYNENFLTFQMVSFKNDYPISSLEHHGQQTVLWRHMNAS